MVKQFLVLHRVCLGAVGLGLGDGVLGVEDALVVVGPLDRGQLDPPEHLWVVLAGGYVLETDGDPVGPGLGQGVGEGVAALGELVGADRNRA